MIKSSLFGLPASFQIHKLRIRHNITHSGLNSDVPARLHESDSIGLTASQICTRSDFFFKAKRKSRRHDMGQTEPTYSIMSYGFSLVTTVQMWHVTQRTEQCPKTTSLKVQLPPSQKQHQIPTYPKNVSLHVLCQRNVPLN